MAAVPAAGKAIGARSAAAGGSKTAAGTAASSGKGLPPAKAHSAKLKAQGQDTTQIRQALKDMGYDKATIDTHAPTGPDPAGPPQSAGSPQSPTSRPATPRGSSRGAGSGLLLGIVLYPIALAALRDGIPGIKAWLRAKFLNQVSASSGRKPAKAVNPGVLSV